MRSRVEELRQQFPRVRPLTDEEVAALADVAFRRFGARSTQSERLAAALMLVILLPLGLWMTAWMLAPILGAAYDRFGTAGPVVVIIGLPIAGLLLLRSLVVTDRVEVLRVSGLLEDDRGFSHCLDCNYDLDGLAHMDHRPGVARCPECGLVQPSRATEEQQRLSRRHVAIRCRHPELREFTDRELDLFVEAAARHDIAAQSRRAWSVGRTLLVLIAVSFMLFATAMLWGPMLEPLFNRLGYWGALPGIILLVIAGSRYVRQLNRTHADVLNRRLTRPRSECLSCGYRLDGLGLDENRPGVVRCPECGLVNPAPTTHQSA